MSRDASLLALSKDRLGALLLLMFCLTYGLLSQDIPLLPGQQDAAFHARTMPIFLTVLGVTLSLLLLLFPPSRTVPQFRVANGLRLVLSLVLMSAFGFALRPLGFLLSTSAFLLLSFALLGERRYGRSIALSVGVAVGFWAIMDLGLGVYISPYPEFLSAAN